MDAAALVGHLVRPGTVYALLAEHKQRLFPDVFFADRFRSGRGRPSVPDVDPVSWTLAADVDPTIDSPAPSSDNQAAHSHSHIDVRNNMTTGPPNTQAAA